MSRLGLFVLLFFIGLPTWAEPITAKIYPTEVHEGEPVKLTLSLSGQQQGEPDLGPLSENFELLSKRRISSLVTNRGATQTQVTWEIGLLPLSVGVLHIPALQVGADTSAPLSIKVLPASNSPSNGRVAPLSIETSIDHERVYVQEQLILSVRIHHSAPIQNLSPANVDIPDARIEQLGEPRFYEETVAGTRQGVIELRYAIYPRKSGEMKIPGLEFSATLASNGPDEDYLYFGPQTGSYHRVKSPEIRVQVKPQPTDYPKDQPWLPARDLQLTESWSEDPDTVSVGASRTQKIQLNVEGQSSNQLPPLQPRHVEGIKYYPDKPLLEDQASEQGITGHMEQSIALVPTRAGKFELPALEVVWWNTRTDRLERARLPDHSIQVTANPDLQASPETTAAPQAPEATPSQPPQALWPWQLATLLLGLSTLICLIALWRRGSTKPPRQPRKISQNTESALSRLRRACADHDAQSARQALDDWAREAGSTLKRLSLTYPELSAALVTLDQALYAPQTTPWRGEALWRAVQNPVNPDGEAQGLPSLYPH